MRPRIKIYRKYIITDKYTLFIQGRNNFVVFKNLQAIHIPTHRSENIFGGQFDNLSSNQLERVRYLS